MEYFCVTEKALESAKTYMPIREKDAFVNECARQCIDVLSVKTGENGQTDVDMPPMYKENTERKSRFLMTALWCYYLQNKAQPVEGTDFLMAADDYDRCAGGHIFNQLERMKGRGIATRGKIFDLMYDYRDLEKRLNAEIFSLLRVMNDPVGRAYMALEHAANAETLQAKMAELEAARNKLEAYRGEKKGG